MINRKTEDELRRILSEFEAPELNLINRVNAGPEEEIYYFEDGEGAKYGLYIKDYLTDLDDEAENLRNNLSIEISSWVPLCKSDEYTTSYDGLSYALFTCL